MAAACCALVFATHQDGLIALENRKIDAYFADRALLFQEQERHAPAPTVQRHKGQLVLASRADDRWDHHAGGEDGVGQLRNAVVRRLGEAQVLLGQTQVAETDLDAGHRRSKVGAGDDLGNFSGGDDGGVGHGV